MTLKESCGNLPHPFDVNTFSVWKIKGFRNISQLENTLFLMKETLKPFSNKIHVAQNNF